MTRRSALLGGRLAPEQWYPAGEQGVTQRFVRVASGTRVRVVEAGESEAPPVLLIHGWGCSIYCYRRIIPRLADAGLRAIAFDLRGHGLSEKPLAANEYTRDAMREHVLEVMDALGLGRVALLAGHSMGGAVATTVASASPQRVGRLALLAPVGFGLVRAVSGARLLTPAAVSPLLASLFGRWSVAATLRVAFGDASARQPGDIEQYWAPSQFPEFIVALRHLVHSFEWGVAPPEDLRKIRLPVAVMAGTRDRIIRWRDVEALARALPDATVRFVSGAGHVLPEERPDEVISVLLDLLTAREPVSEVEALTAER